MAEGITALTEEDRSVSHKAWCYQFGLLLKRNFLNQYRLPQTSTVKLLVVIITALFTIILYYNIEDNLQGVQNRNGALFFITLNMALLAI
mmetsp:Transcript_23288/g.17718  ORF Transcript_23288/g.17718 Transcript_23288/m.17718 type:complete len:90 (+) Transcript_23288:646-915(+)